MITSICAVSEMKFLDFLIGNLGLAISDIPLIYTGATISDFTKLKSGTTTPLNWVFIGIGFIIVIVIIGLVTYYAHREFKRSLKE